MTDKEKEQFRAAMMKVLSTVNPKDFQRDIDYIKEMFSAPDAEPSPRWKIYIEVAMECGLL